MVNVGRLLDRNLLAVASAMGLTGMSLVRAAVVSRANEFDLVSRVSCDDATYDDCRIGSVKGFLAYRHRETGMRVLLTQLESPLFKLNITVPVRACVFVCEVR